ncbi:hypothetical protein BB561_003499 [Smittium simulii]|uniref:Lariat debranching enzyme C-terminal domain-containing protein n=1 Tax=Smittium simulii TaxID=133385 RepID=A0A2T9YKX8_9FUNG|nr:hypothetical protein BB561_003499 [Smittium simulii]
MKNKVLQIAIEGCCHGELDKIYNALSIREAKNKKKVDLLIICGDFQAMRNPSDMNFMCCPDKYKRLGGFYRYYTGEKKAPVPTIFIGGNHEASNYSRELFMGGWAAPNIYFMGLSNVIWFKGLRIGGISGIFNENNFNRGYYEHPPFMPIDRFKSLYHTRIYECLKLMQLELVEPRDNTKNLNDGDTNDITSNLSNVDMFVSHEWPRHIAKLGNLKHLLKIKPWFKSDVSTGKLGSANLEDLFNYLKPRYWFSAHLHVRYEVKVDWNQIQSVSQVETQSISNSPVSVINEQEISLEGFDDSDNDSKIDQKISSPTELNIAENKVPPILGNTTFLALDKCLPRRGFLEILEVQVSDPHSEYPGSGFKYDPEWIAIQKVFQPLMPRDKYVNEEQMLLWNNLGQFKDQIKQTKQELLDTIKDWTIPQNFVKTALGAIPGTNPNMQPSNLSRFYNFYDNPQTRYYHDYFGIKNIFEDHYNQK